MAKAAKPAVAEEGEPLHIVALKAENFKVLKAVRITPTGDLVVISGKNGNGKTSVMDAIEAAFGGKEAFPSKPVRKGEKKAEIEVDLGEIKIRRTITPDGAQTFSLIGSKGESISSPQTVLNALYERQACDPIRYMTLKPSEQAAILSKMAGVDAASYEGRKKTAFDERTAVNRELKSHNADVESYKVALERSLRDAGLKEPIKDKIVASELLSKLKEAEAHNKANQEKRRSLEAKKATARDLGSKLASIQSAIERKEAELRELREDMGRVNLSIDEHNKAVNEFEESVSKLEDIDPRPIMDEIEGAEKKNATARAKADLDKAMALAAEAKEKSEALTARIHAIDDEMKEALEKAKLPIEGLSFTSAGVQFNGTDLEECSAAEQLRVSAAIAMSSEHRIRVMLIRDGCKLDSDSLKLLAEMGQARGYQLFVEMVEHGAESGIRIVDGEVQPERGVEDAAS